MKAVDGLSGAAISRATAELIAAQPQLASWDFVMDVRHSPTGSTVEDFKIVLAAYRQVAREPGVKYGCYVSEDPNYRLWASTMSAMFEDRDCPVFYTPEAAHAFLDERRGFAAAPAHAAAGA